MNVDYLGQVAGLIAHYRRDLSARTGCAAWDAPGIAAAMRAQTGHPLQTIAAMAALAADPAMRYPTALASRGHWWPSGPQATGPTQRHTMRCHEHPTQDVPCRICRDLADRAQPVDPQFVANLRAQVRAATHQTPQNVAGTAPGATNTAPTHHLPTP